MALQFSVAVRNARLAAIPATVGVSPKLMLYSGTAPANCAAAATGTLLATITLPATWEATPASGQSLLAGTWSGTASVAGTVGYARIMDSAQTTAHVQGTVTVSGGGGDFIIDNPVLAVSQTANETSFTLTEANS